jgi:glycosyltransferase involved in cell wall biosynthesis
MKNDLFISVIIPVYNVEKYVRKSINSILEQTYKNYEIILIDDGSTDSSGKICDEYASKYECIKVFHQKNSGQSVARNRGIEEASGKYICFLDSDDWYSNNALEEFVNLVNNYNVDISIINVFNTTKEENQYTAKNDIKVYEQTEALTQLFKNASVFGTSCNKLYKKELFDNIKFPPNRFWEDMYISFDILMENTQVAFSKNACLYYRHRQNSTTTSKFSKRNLDEYFALTHINESIKKTNYRFLLFKNNSRCLNYLMKTYIKLGESDLLDREKLMVDYKNKIFELFKSQPFLRWSFKDIKRYFLFLISPKVFKLFVKGI